MQLGMSNSCISVSIFTGFQPFFFAVHFWLISPGFKSGYFPVNEIGGKITSYLFLPQGGDGMG